MNTGANGIPATAGAGRFCRHRSPFRLVIAGAGTGGHLFPGIAVAEALVRRVPGSRVLFVVTGRPVEEAVLSGLPFETARVSAAALKGMGWGARLRSLLVTTPKGLFQSLGLLRRFSPHAVLGMGGYSAAPVIMAAFLMRIPRFIHEQNRVAGMTNRWLSRLAGQVFVSFRDTRIGCRPGKIQYTGLPVREPIRECAGARMRDTGNRKEKPFTLLVLGGSQGARNINRAVVEAFSFLRRPADFRVIHQTGPADEVQVRRFYEETGVPATVSAFFRDMAAVYREADFAVCRAGAATVSEIAVVGLPAVFIPYPYAADDHQAANARSLADIGAAEIIPERELSGRALAECLEAYAYDAARFERAARAARSAGRPDAAGAIVDAVIASAGFSDFGNTGGK